VFAPFAAAQDSAKSTKLTIEQLIEISIRATRCGRRMASTLFLAGIGRRCQSLYSNADGHGQPVAVTSFPKGKSSKPFWAGDSQTVYFPHDGHLWQAAIDASGGGSASQCGLTAGTNPSLPFHLTQSGSRLSAPAAGTIAPRKNRPGDPRSPWERVRRRPDNVSIAHPIWSPDGASLAYTAGSKTINHDETPGYSGKKIFIGSGSSFQDRFSP